MQAKLADRLLIVPRAHVSIFATRFQVEMYELFHRTTGGRLGHLLGSPIIIAGLVALLATLTGAVWPGLLVVGLVAVFGVLVTPLVAIITAAYSAALFGLGTWLAGALGDSAVVGSIVLVVAGTAIQVTSHVFEDIPPPHSGTKRFVPVRVWMKRIDLKEILRTTALTYGVFFWLELWATPRIISLQLLHVLMRLGYRPALRREIDQRMAEILADPSDSWRGNVRRGPV